MIRDASLPIELKLSSDEALVPFLLSNRGPGAGSEGAHVAGSEGRTGSPSRVSEFPFHSTYQSVFLRRARRAAAAKTR